MNEDSIQLLKEIDSGCFMAINSLHQMEEYDMPTDQHDMLTKYVEQHDAIQKEASTLLHRNDETDKQPGMMASAMSWLTTEIKMMLHDDSTQIAKIMMNGCNMGIQTIREHMTQYKDAATEVMKLAEKLIKVEENMFKEAETFI